MSEQIQVSTVKSAYSTETQDFDAHGLVSVIRTGGKELRGKVERLRDAFARELGSHGDQKRAKRAVSELKTQLPGVLWSGKFSKRDKEGLVSHSGLLCADLDSLNGS